MIRRLKHSVCKYKICGSDSVFSQSGKYLDKKKHWSVICSNPDCRERTPGYSTQENALKDWNNGWGK